MHTYIHSYIHILFPPELTSFPSLCFVVNAVIVLADMGYLDSFFNTNDVI